MTERKEAAMDGTGTAERRLYRFIARGKARRFEITGGLRKGYADTGLDAALCEVVAAHHAWQRETGQVFGALIQPATVSYGWPEAGQIRTDSEPGFILFGTINVLYQAGEDDGTCLGRVRALALFLADWLGQQRIYLTYGDIAEVVERAECEKQDVPGQPGEEGQGQ
jgi:hypothetical protein